MLKKKDKILIAGQEGMVGSCIYKLLKKNDYNADYIMKHGILIGCHNSMTTGEINYLIEKINLFINKLKI